MFRLTRFIPGSWQATKAALTQNKGLTLVELTIAIVILTIGTIATMRSFDAATRATAGLDARMLSRIALQNRSAELGLYGPNATLPSQVTIANQSITLSRQLNPTSGGLIQITLTARMADQGGAQTVLYLDPVPRQ